MRGDEQIECALADGVLCEKAARYSKMPFGKTFYMMHLIIETFYGNIRYNYLDFRAIILCEESDECITLLADRHSFM